MKLSHNDDKPPDLPRLLADEITFTVAKFRVLYRVRPVTIIGVLTVVINELIQSGTTTDEDEGADEPINFNRN